MTVILASQSPRRKELLRWLIPEFQVVPADINEQKNAQETAENYVQRMAREKAAATAKHHPTALVIASDTTVVLDGQTLGKPQNRAEAFDMLRSLSGQTHRVYTSVILRQGEHVEEALTSAEVTFYPLTNAEIDRYLNTGDHKDKAGAYGIQNEAGIFVKEIRGDYYSIVGFPVGKVNQLLKEFGF